MSMLVHKAVEPDNLTKRGQANLTALLGPRINDALLLPKLDGVYAQFKYGADGWRAWSRTGEPMPSLETPERLEWLAYRADADKVYVGEAWTPRTPHAAINGMARRQSPQAGLEWWLHDVFSEHHIAWHGRDDRPFLERFDSALQIEHMDSGTKVVPSMFIRDVAFLMGDATMDNLLAYTKSVQAHALSLGNVYDGLILRDNGEAFVPGLGKDGGIYKLKPRKSLDLRVVAETVVQQPTKLGGFLTVEYRGKRTDVGSGLTQGMLTLMREQAIDNRTMYVGTIAEVEFLEFTKDGRLREPVLKAIRYDKEQPDV